MYDELPEDDPKSLTSAIWYLSYIVHGSKKPLEEIIVFPNHEKENNIIDYLNLAKEQVKV